MVRIAHCESQMNNCVTNWYNWIGTTDWGLFQINEIWIPGDRYALYDPWLNAEYALMVFEQQGLGAWVCHNL